MFKPSTDLVIIANTIDSWIKNNPKGSVKDPSGKKIVAVLVGEENLATIRDSIFGSRKVTLTTEAAAKFKKRQEEYKAKGLL